MRYVTIDLEATCWQGGGPFQRENTEIIEIGAVSIVDGSTVEKEFNQYIKPVKHPILTDYCTALTGITQAQVDSAETANRVYVKFTTWLSTGQDLLGGTLVSWGAWDWKVMKREFEQHTVFKFPFNTHINLKNSFAAYEGSRPKGLHRAIESLGWKFEGKHHCGMDDAHNTAKIFKFLKKEAQHVLVPVRQ